MAVAELTPEEKLEFRKRCARDPVFFTQKVLKHWFKEHPPWFHRGILAILWQQVDFLEEYGEVDQIIAHFEYERVPGDPASGMIPIFYRDESGHLCMDITSFTQIRMPRGFSKTTLLNAKVLHSVIEGVYRFPVYLSATASHAEDQLDTVKSEITSNEIILAVWGNLKPKTGDGQWTQSQCDLTNGVHVRARGAGAQIRGQNVGAQRPDCLIFDDVEDRESVLTEEQRKKTRDWAYKDVLPALPTGRTDCPVFVLGTLLHNDSLLITFEKDPRFTTVKFGTRTKYDQTYGSIWPLVQPMVQAVYAAAEKVDQLAGYFMEYEGEIRNEQTAIFKEAYIKIKPLTEGEPLTHAIALDPAISAKATADFAAIVAVSMGLRSGTIWVRKVWAQRGASPREIINKYFEFYSQFGTGGEGCACGVESIQYQAALIHLLREDMFRRGQYFEVIPITHSVHKETRIRGVLQPRYASGTLYHAEKFLELESQLKDFPNGKKDIPDALAMAVSLLDPYAAAAADPNKDLGDDEYQPLELLSPV